MSDRYFVPEGIHSDRVTLRGAEAHHLLHVMRAGTGAVVMLFDGSGSEFVARIERHSRSEVELLVESRHAVNRELSAEFILAVALPKGDRARWLVEKSTEIGVTRLIPLVTQRGVARPIEASLKRLRRTVVEASKQCGRNRLMPIDEPLAWSEFVSASHEATLRLVAHPGCSNPAIALGEVHRDGGPAMIAVGPEGGFSDEEIALALNQGWRRVETAAIMAASYLTMSGGEPAKTENKKTAQ